MTDEKKPVNPIHALAIAIDSLAQAMKKMDARITRLEKKRTEERKRPKKN